MSWIFFSFFSHCLKVAATSVQRSIIKPAGNCTIFGNHDVLEASTETPETQIVSHGADGKRSISSYEASGMADKAWSSGNELESKANPKHRGVRHQNVHEPQSVDELNLNIIRFIVICWLRCHVVSYTFTNLFRDHAEERAQPKHAFFNSWASLQS